MTDLQVELEKAMRARDFAGVRDKLDNLPPSEIADLISDAPGDEQALFFRCLPRRLATTTFEYLPLDRQHDLLKSLANEAVAEILYQMSDDDRTTLLEELPGAATKQLLELLSDDE